MFQWLLEAGEMLLDWGVGLPLMLFVWLPAFLAGLVLRTVAVVARTGWRAGCEVSEKWIRW